MAVSVVVPVRLRVDPRGLEEGQHDLAGATRAAVLRALARSRGAVRTRGRYLTPHVEPPHVSWTGPGSRTIGTSLRQRIEALVVGTIRDAVAASGIDAAGASAGGQVLPDGPFELLRDAQLVSSLGLYVLPSYDGAGDVAVPIEDEDGAPEVAVERSEEADRQLRFFPFDVPDVVLGRAFFDEWRSRLRELRSPYVAVMFRTAVRGTRGIGIAFLGFADPHDVRPETLRFRVRRALRGTLTELDATTTPPRLRVRELHPDAGQLHWLRFLETDPATARQRLRTERRRELRALVDAERDKLQGLASRSQLDRLIEEGVSRALSDVESVQGLAEFRNPSMRILVEWSERLTPSLQGLEVLLVPLTEVARATRDDESGAGGGGEPGDTADGAEGSESRAPVPGIGTGEEGRLYPRSTREPRDASAACAPFEHEPPLEQLGEHGVRIRRLVDEIATYLEMPPCGYAARFLLEAWLMLNARAAAVGDFAVTERGRLATAPIGSRSGNLGALHFEPSASPAIRLLRHLAGVTPLLRDLQDVIERLYERPEVVASFGSPYYRSNVVSWKLRFYGALNTAVTEAVAVMFGMTCRVVLLQLLRFSAEQIQGRLANLSTYAVAFERLIRTQLVRVATLRGWRERLVEAEPSLAAQPRPPDESAGRWTIAWRAVVETVGATPSSGPTIDGGEGTIVRQPNHPVAMKDAKGRLWTIDEIDRHIAAGELVAHADPLVQQIQAEGLLERFLDPGSLVVWELFKLLVEMRDKNAEIQREVAASWMYAFKLSAIRREFGEGHVAGYQLTGLHRTAHELLADAFGGRGRDYYQAGIAYLLGGELGRRNFVQNFSLIEIAFLAVVCPPAAIGAGAALAAHQYLEAREHAQVWGALIDPTAFMSRAEVEADLFAAEVGLALTFLPSVAGRVARLGTPLARGAARLVPASVRQATAGAGRAAEPILARGRELVRRAQPVTEPVLAFMKGLQEVVRADLGLAVAAELLKIEGIGLVLDKVLVGPIIQRLFAEFDPEREMVLARAGQPLEILLGEE